MTTTTRLPRRLAASTAAVGLLLTGAAAVSAVPSSGSAAVAHRAPAAKPRTLVFTSITKTELQPSRTEFIAHSIDRQGSKVIGYDLLSGRFDPKTERVVLHLAVALRGGLVFMEIAGPGGATDYTGRITGGSGKFAGVTGTVKAKQLDDMGQRTRVTMTYRL